MPRPLGSKNKNTERMQLLEKQLTEQKAQNKMIRQELAKVQEQLSLSHQHTPSNTDPITKPSTSEQNAKHTPVSEHIFNIREDRKYPAWASGEIASASRYQKQFLVEVVHHAQSQFETKTFTEDHSERCRGSGFYYPPCPLTLSTKPEPFHHYLKPIFIWRPDISFEIPQIGCTAEKCNGNLRSNGLYSNGPLKFVSLKDVGYIVSWSYRCSSCSRQLCGWSEEFLKVLPSHVQQWFPFALHKTSAIHHEIIELISLQFSDLRVAGIEQLIAEYHSSKYLQEHVLYLQRCAAYKEHLTNQQGLMPLENSAIAFAKFSKLEDSGGYDGLGSIDCADIVKSYLEAENEYKDIVQRRIVGEKILCADYSNTFNTYINIAQRRHFKNALFAGMLSAAGTNCDRCGRPKTKVSHPSRQWKCDDGIPCRMKEVAYPFKGSEEERTLLIEQELRKGTFRQQKSVKKRSHDTFRRELLDQNENLYPQLSSTWTDWHTDPAIGEVRVFPAHPCQAFSVRPYNPLTRERIYQHPYRYSELSSSSIEWTSNLSAEKPVEEDPLVPVQRGQNFYVLE